MEGKQQLPTPTTGAVVHIGNADANHSRIVVDSYGTSVVPNITFHINLHANDLTSFTKTFWSSVFHRNKRDF